MAKFGKIGITGLGLIGGSLALEIKKRKLAEKVIGFSRRHSTLEKAKSQGLIDYYYTNFEDGIRETDFLIIATPVDVIRDYLLKIKKNNPSILVTDVASVKSEVVKDAIKILGRNSNFVGSHPIAGSEKGGIESVRENLFENKFVIITPCRYTKKENVEKIKEFWIDIGSIPVILSPEEHDRLLALTSHIPHLIVFLLLSLFEKIKDKDSLLPCIGSGFLDTTRIGSSSPELWAGIFISNKKNILKYLYKFEKNLSEMGKIIRKGDKKKLTDKLTTFKKVRDEINAKRQNI